MPEDLRKDIQEILKRYRRDVAKLECEQDAVIREALEQLKKVEMRAPYEKS